MISIFEERGIIKGLERGIAQGMEQGIAQGFLRGKRDTTIRLLRVRFGDLPNPLIAAIEAMDADQLDALMENALTAATLDDLGAT